jgi:hypothetical protein
MNKETNIGEFSSKENNMEFYDKNKLKREIKLQI